MRAGHVPARGVPHHAPHGRVRTLECQPDREGRDWLLLEPHLRSRRPPRIVRAAAIAGGAMLLAVRFETPPVAVLALAAAAGWAWQADA
jgi:hypothetical protein